jgi:hypothetical protein
MEELTKNATGSAEYRRKETLIGKKEQRRRDFRQTQCSLRRISVYFA